jgi:hypothetical protein
MRSGFIALIAFSAANRRPPPIKSGAGFGQINVIAAQFFDGNSIMGICVARQD